MFSSWGAERVQRLDRRRWEMRWWFEMGRQEFSKARVMFGEMNNNSIRSCESSIYFGRLQIFLGVKKKIWDHAC
jgi:hypothetical protein